MRIDQLVSSPLMGIQLNFSRTLEAFMLHALSPVGSEALTKKFEQLDQMIPTNEQCLDQFYQKFYSVFDDQLSAMVALLSQKELFACQLDISWWLGFSPFQTLENM